MKKTVLAIALMILLKPVLPVLDYMINYEYIATELCENTERPELHCNGKCHLAKELAKASETEKPLSEKKSVHAEAEVLFFEAVSQFDFSMQISANIVITMPEYCNRYSHLDAISVFHPPVFIS